MEPNTTNHDERAFAFLDKHFERMKFFEPCEGVESDDCLFDPENRTPVVQWGVAGGQYEGGVDKLEWSACAYCCLMKLVSDTRKDALFEGEYHEWVNRR